MRLGLIESAWLGTEVGPTEGIRLAKEIGFDTYDIFRDPRETSAKLLRQMREAFQKSGLKPVAVTAVASGLLDINASLRKSTLGWVREQLGMGYDMGCDRMLLVLGEYIWEKKIIKPEEQWGWAVEGLREAGDHARSLGMHIALELEPFEMCLLNSIDEMIRFLDDVNHRAVYANADVSHLHLLKIPAHDLKKLKGRVVHVHLSDNNGKVHGDLPAGRGSAPLKDYLRILKEMGYDGSVSIELEYSPNPAKIKDWVTEAYIQTARMMEELRVRSR